MMNAAQMNIAEKVKRFLVSEDGPTAVEYAVMLALIIIVCLATITAIGNNANASHTIAIRPGCWPTPGPAWATSWS